MRNIIVAFPNEADITFENPISGINDSATSTKMEG